MQPTPIVCSNCDSEIANRGELIETTDGKKFCDEECYRPHRITELEAKIAELRGQWTEEYFAKLIANNPKPEDFNADDEAWAKWLCKMHQPLTQEGFWHFCQQQQEDEFNHDTWENWRIAITRAFDLLRERDAANKRAEAAEERARLFDHHAHDPEALVKERDAAVVRVEKAEARIKDLQAEIELRERVEKSWEQRFAGMFQRAERAEARAAEIEGLFSAGEKHASVDEDTGGRTECPYADGTIERHWWTRGYAYMTRILRALKAEEEVRTLKARIGTMEEAEAAWQRGCRQAESNHETGRVSGWPYIDGDPLNMWWLRGYTQTRYRHERDAATALLKPAERLGASMKLADFTELCRIEREGQDPLHTVYLKVGVQRFALVPDQLQDIGQAEWYQRMLIYALSNLVDQYSPNRRIEDLKKQVSDRDGRIGQYRWNQDQIGQMLAEFRERRSTGEPARSDVEEVRALIERLRKAETDRDRTAATLEASHDANMAFKEQWLAAETREAQLRQSIGDIVNGLDEQSKLSDMAAIDDATQAAITEADRIAGLLRGALAADATIIQAFIERLQKAQAEISNNEKAVEGAIVFAVERLSERDEIIRQLRDALERCDRITHERPSELKEVYNLLLAIQRETQAAIKTTEETFAEVIRQVAAKCGTPQAEEFAEKLLAAKPCEPQTDNGGETNV